MGVMLGCVVLQLLAPSLHWVWVIGFWGTAAFLLGYCTRDIKRWFDERRWRNSPGPTDTLDDL